MRPRGKGAASQARMLVLEASESIPAIDLAEADEWHVLVTVEGTPSAFVVLPSPGRTAGEGIARDVLVRQGEWRLGERQLEAALRDRLGAPEPARVDLSCSVVCCTYRRPHLLRGLLESVQRLDPAPAEVIVVDNDPVPNGSREEAGRFGARYVNEARRGLNEARRTGLRVARGDLVAFTDDDCIVPPAWLRGLPMLFADPTVAAVTGPGFPSQLETRSQVLRERVTPYLQGTKRTVFDWTTISVVDAGRVGTGANMILRQALLADGDALFPPELDVGTPSRSGGDLYALSRILADGYRVIYDPDTYILHRHGREPPAATRTTASWGTGMAAFFTRALVRDREVMALTGLNWVLRKYVSAVLDGVEGHGDPVELRLRWTYLRAALAGPFAWRRALTELRRKPPRAGIDSPAQVLVLAGGAGDATADPLDGSSRDAPPPPETVLSVVITSTSDPRRLLLRLEAMARAEQIDAGWELIVVSPDAAEAMPDRVGSRTPVRWLKEPGGRAAAANAGARVARGEVLLMLDDELTFEPGLLAAHLGHHGDGGERAVVGYSPERPREHGLAALLARLRSEDEFRFSRETAARTAAEVSIRNLSLRRSMFERLGGFDSCLGPERAGWELGIRAIEAGVEIVHEPRAAAVRSRSVTTSRYVEEALAAGRDEARVLGRHREAGPLMSLAPTARGPTGRGLERLAASLLRQPRVRRGAHLLLDALEALRYRRTWLRLATTARRGAYEQGFRSVSGQGGTSAADDRIRVIELDSGEPILPAAGSSPVVELRLRGRMLARVRPPGGRWHPSLFEQALDELDRHTLAGLLPLPAGAEPDLSSAAVVFGPRRRPGDDRHRAAFEAAGASVIAIDGGRRPRDHWAAVDAGIRELRCDPIGVPIPGVSVEPSWLESVLPGLAGPRVAAVVGFGVAADERPGPLRLISRTMRRRTYGEDIPASQFIAIRRDRYEELGGFDPDTAYAGLQGPVVEFVERALEAGLVIGSVQTHGLTPPATSGRARAQGRWLVRQARGALLLRRAQTIGGVRGAAWFASRALLPLLRRFLRKLSDEPTGLLRWTASTAAFVTGCLLTVGDQVLGASRPRRRG